MISKQCFTQGCNLEVQYICQCSSSGTYSCEKHIGIHCNLPNKDHLFYNIFLEHFEKTKEVILNHLAKEKSKNEKLKEKILESFNYNLKANEGNLKESLRKLDTDLLEICNWIEKISQAQKISTLKQDPLLKLLTLNPEDSVKSIKEMTSANSYKTVKLFCMLNEEIKNKVESFIKNHFEVTQNTIISGFEKGLENNYEAIYGKIEEMSHFVFKIIDDNNKDFEGWKQKINIEKRVEEQDKCINCKIEEINHSAIHMINEKENNFRKKIEDLNKEINIERWVIELDKNINRRLAEIIRSISNMIDERERHISRKIEEINIERRLEEYWETIKGKIADINENKDRNKRNFEEWKLELNAENVLENLNHKINIDTRNQVNLLSSQINPTIDDLNKKINENQLITPQDLKTKKLAILSKANDPEIEREFRATCLAYEKQCSDLNLPLSQDYEQLIKDYHLKTTLYRIEKVKNRSVLIIFNTENNREEIIKLDAPEQLSQYTCFTQLPNGELFCFGKNDPPSGITLIIDRNYKVRILPSCIPCYWSSCIYFNNSVYCFWGYNDEDSTALSIKFDLNKNQWINLSPMPHPDRQSNLVMFNGNILISGLFSRNILRYSVDSDTFLIIPYEFEHYKRKILINVERLYLIECLNGFIY